MQRIRAIAAMIVAVSIFNRITFLSAQRLHIEIEGHRLAQDAWSASRGTCIEGVETMKQLIFGLVIVILVGASVTPVAVGETNGRFTEAAIDLRAFPVEAAMVEREIATPSEFHRDDLLLMYGRSSAASGRFDVAAAAYAMFLDEFGTDHPNSENVAVRLADCLFPFKYDEVNIVHTPSGPRLDPAWRMGFAPRPEHLQHVVQVFELAASLAQDQHAKGSALLKLGWLHRVLDEWDASTTAWDRRAKEAAPTKLGADALWLAAENLEWTNYPAEAAARLGRMGSDYPDDARTSAARDRIEQLQAEARRSAEWLSDPLASVAAEIESRAPARSPFEVYRSVVRWLQRRGEREALIAVGRWACSQDGWPVKERIACRFDLADALMQGGDAEARNEAAERLREIVEIAPDFAAAVPAGLRRARVLDGLERFSEAEETFKGLVDRVNGSARWEPLVVTEYADWLVKRGNKDRAIYVLNSLAASHPDFHVAERLEAVRKADGKEGGR